MGGKHSKTGQSRGKLKSDHTEIIVKPAKRLLKALLKADNSPQNLQLALLNRICKGWVVEHKFHMTRKWKFDFANPRLKIAVEIEGGAWMQGRHTRGAGFIADMEKYNEAVLMGWRVLRYTPQQSAKTLKDIERLTS